VPMFSIGDRVAQPQYGTGTVTISNDRHTVIEFDEHGPRTFITQQVQLERSTTLAPPKPTRAKRAKRAVKVPAATAVATAAGS
jgi:hypothetical protein